MLNVLLVIHLMVAAALVAVVLLQKSEGGALGIGGGGAGGFLTGRGTANLLTRTTAALAIAFFITSIVLTILARQGTNTGSVLDQKGGAPATSTSGAPAAGGEGDKAAPGRGGILDKLQQQPSGPLVPQNR